MLKHVDPLLATALEEDSETDKQEKTTACMSKINMNWHVGLERASLLLAN